MFLDFDYFTFTNETNTTTALFASWRLFDSTFREYLYNLETDLSYETTDGETWEGTLREFLNEFDLTSMDFLTD